MDNSAGALQTKGTLWVFGSGGIGQGVIEELKNKYQVTSIDKDAFSTDCVDSYSVDLANDDASIQLQAIAQVAGYPNYVAVCAGQVSPARVETALPTEIKAVIDNNLLLVVHVLKALHDFERPLRVVIIVSNAAFVARSQQPLYAATKAAIVSLIKSLSIGWADRGIRLVGLAPGTVSVPRNQDRVSAAFPDAPYASDRPGGRILMPSDVGVAVDFFMQQADHFTGRTITIDAGSTL
jgi:NAD(P)-dependent dehydrogenase (short-subunit alcohol dehydrogenase family)